MAHLSRTLSAFISTPARALLAPLFLLAACGRTPPPPPAPPAPPPAAEVQPLQVAVAANFASTMKELAEDFTRRSGRKVELSFGSTGKFYAQIKSGAPFDVLLAADAATPAKLEAEGAGVAGSRFTYATGRLALWSASQPVDQGALADGKFNHLAIADPKLAPYGAAAMEVLEKLGVKETLRGRIVTGENIAQAHQFVESGNAELGFIALSQVSRDGKVATGHAWIVPAELHRPIRQEALLLAHGKDHPAGAALLKYLQSEDARKVIRAYGYTAD